MELFFSFFVRDGEVVVVVGFWSFVCTVDDVVAIDR